MQTYYNLARWTGDTWWVATHAFERLVTLESSARAFVTSINTDCRLAKHEAGIVQRYLRDQQDLSRVRVPCNPTQMAAGLIIRLSDGYHPNREIFFGELVHRLPALETDDALILLGVGTPQEVEDLLSSGLKTGPVALLARARTYLS